jgi:hypothetical protein
MVNIESTLGRGAEQSEKDQEVCGKLSLNFS